MPEVVASDIYPGLTPKQALLRRRMLSPLTWRLFAARKLPSVWFWGVRVRELDPRSCSVTMPFGWRTQNPFRSAYFAAQCGAAELSTGALALLHLAGRPSVSMLVTRFDSEYYKKAADPLRFVCGDGEAIAAAVAGAVADGEARAVTVVSEAFLPGGVRASHFEVTWSFRRK